MIESWKAALRVATPEVKLWVSTPEVGEVLKARLPSTMQHPRALLTVLEGLALWAGRPICAAFVADDLCRSWFDSGLFGDELWPGPSPLVRFELVHPARRGAGRIRGMGEFGRGPHRPGARSSAG
jgi:hypothetical protein